METATVWVLVALICVEMNIACALSSPKKLQKPGACPEPPPGRMGICIDECIDDKSCPKDQKCCSTGCGHRCLSLVFNETTCSWEGDDSEAEGSIHLWNTFNGRQECAGTGANGKCSRKKTLQKPGSCPRAHTGGVGICVESCLDDLSCPREMKCCSNGCGHVCMRPVFITNGSPVKAAFGSYKHD